MIAASHRMRPDDDHAESPDLLAAIVGATLKMVAVRAAAVSPVGDGTARGRSRAETERSENALERADRINVIAECKRRSPSRGVLKADYDPASIARGYEHAGASAISVLTEPTFFDGSLEHLVAVRRATFAADSAEGFYRRSVPDSRGKGGRRGRDPAHRCCVDAGRSASPARGGHTRRSGRGCGSARLVGNRCRARRRRHHYRRQQSKPADARCRYGRESSGDRIDSGGRRRCRRKRPENVGRSCAACALTATTHF